jgi:hypothetical protein
MLILPDTPPTAPSGRIYRRRLGEPVVHVYAADGFARCGADSPHWLPVNPEHVHPEAICQQCSLAECLRQTSLRWGPETPGYAPGELAERWLAARAYHGPEEERGGCLWAPVRFVARLMLQIRGWVSW